MVSDIMQHCSMTLPPPPFLCLSWSNCEPFPLNNLLMRQCDSAVCGRFVSGFVSCCRMTVSSIPRCFGWPRMTRGRWVQAGRGLGKLLILNWSYSVKNLSKHCESTAKLRPAPPSERPQQVGSTFLSFHIINTRFLTLF